MRQAPFHSPQETTDALRESPYLKKYLSFADIHTSGEEMDNGPSMSSADLREMPLFGRRGNVVNLMPVLAQKGYFMG